MRKWTRRDVVKGGLAGAGGLMVPKWADALVNGAANTLHEDQQPPFVDLTQHPPFAAGARERLLLDFGWKFHFGHASDPGLDFGYGRGNDGAFAKTGHLFAPARERFDASTWRDVNLPHDWAVELPFVNDPALTSHGFKPVGRAYPATSVGWYRKSFAIPATDAGRRLWLEFDGVYRNAIVALNGIYLTTALSGYAPFSVDITDMVHVGAENVLCLRVDATENEGWFYEGAGMYRHAWLVKAAPVHVPQWGTFVTSEVRGHDAEVTVQVTVANDSGADTTCRVGTRIVDDAGTSRGTARSGTVRLPAWESATVSLRTTVHDADLWSIEHPALYRAQATIEVDGAVVDGTETPFGIRTLRWDADRGFFLNGQHVELQGTCNHQDHAGVGSALPDRLQYYRIARLKEMGCNAYRTSHNPPTPELLDACDRLGMLVLDETRMFASSQEGLSQFERLIRRDRNHPSVFCWSIGNEEPTQATDVGARMAASMKRLARRLDPTRPITEAMDDTWGPGLSAVVDVQGFNYGDDKRIDAFRAKFPTKWSMGTEVGSTVSTRGIYANDKVRGYVEAYDTQFPPWAATAEHWWSTYAARAFLAGGFVWTGFDYRGEPTPYGWPCINSHFGIMDTCGFAKDNFYYYKAWWGRDPVVHILPHWNWPGREGQDVRVWVHANVDEVELLLNGTSLGRQRVTPNAHLAWQVPYAPGTLEARGFTRGQQVLVDRRETTGAPSAITLTPDRATIDADGEDVSVIVVRVVDAQGRVVPVAGDEIEFTVSGAGTLIGLGNGDPSDHTPDKGTVRRAFNGLCMAIVQSGRNAGTITIRAAADGLAPASVDIACRSATLRPSLP